MTVAHPAYIALGLGAAGIVLVIAGLIAALKPALRVARHAEQIADDAIFLQAASLQMQFERLSHVGSEVEPLAARARAALAAMKTNVAQSGLSDVTLGVRASVRSIREIIATFR